MSPIALDKYLAIQCGLQNACLYPPQKNRKLLARFLLIMAEISLWHQVLYVVYLTLLTINESIINELFSEKKKQYKFCARLYRKFWFTVSLCDTSK